MHCANDGANNRDYDSCTCCFHVLMTKLYIKFFILAKNLSFFKNWLKNLGNRNKKPGFR